VAGLLLRDIVAPIAQATHDRSGLNKL